MLELSSARLDRKDATHPVNGFVAAITVMGVPYRKICVGVYEVVTATYYSQSSRAKFRSPYCIHILRKVCLYFECIGLTAPWWSS